MLLQLPASEHFLVRENTHGDSDVLKSAYLCGPTRGRQKEMGSLRFTAANVLMQQAALVGLETGWGICFLRVFKVESAHPARWG